VHGVGVGRQIRARQSEATKRSIMKRADHDDTQKRPAKPVEQPVPPFPEQHQQQPGLESELDPAPRWRGERYKSADKLAGMVALMGGPT
jgi:hypothetical protein